MFKEEIGNLEEEIASIEKLEEFSLIKLLKRQLEFARANVLTPGLISNILAKKKLSFVDIKVIDQLVTYDLASKLDSK